MKLQTALRLPVLLIFFLFAISSLGRARSPGPAATSGASIAGRKDPRPAKLNCRIDRISPKDRHLSVNCLVSTPPSSSLSVRFTDQFAGLDRLSERVFNLKIRDEKGGILPPEIHGDGLYLLKNSDHSPMITIDYEIRLARVLDPSQYALTSSLGPEAGSLMLNDLLPKICANEDGECETKPALVQIVPPADWKIATTEKTEGDLFEVADPQGAVFFLGRLRERTIPVNSMRIKLAVAGAWSFRDDDILALTEAIAREQAAIMESVEEGDFLVTLAPFPLPLTGLRSSALTVKRTVVLQLNANDNPMQTFAHFRRHLAHEMFHFYLPNAFRVRENFDWFWEGFTRYIALLTIARLRLIGLREYLNAIGEEYEAYAFNPSRTQVSLIAASPEKFANYASYDLVYRKGMLVAALYDLELRWQSKGSHKVADVMRGLYQDYARHHLEVGNSEILSALNRMGNFTELIRNDIEGTREIAIIERIKPYGLVIEWSPATRGKVSITKSSKLSARQRSLFEQLAIEK